MAEYSVPTLEVRMVIQRLQHRPRCYQRAWLGGYRDEVTGVRAFGPWLEGQLAFARIVQTFDPTEGDKDVPPRRCLRNEVIEAKRCGRCWWCGGLVEPGQRCLAFRYVDADGFYGGRLCHPCCRAYAVSTWTFDETFAGRRNYPTGGG